MSTYEWLCLIGVLAAGFWTIHHDLQNFVRREDCKEDMGEHCSQIGGIERRLGKVENRVTKLETEIEVTK